MHSSVMQSTADRFAGQPATTNEVKALESISNRVDNLLDRAERLAIAVEAIGDRAFGERVSGETERSIAPVRSGAVGRIEDDFDKLDASLSRLHRAIERVEKLA